MLPRLDHLRTGRCHAKAWCNRIWFLVFLKSWIGTGGSGRVPTPKHGIGLALHKLLDQERCPSPSIWKKQAQDPERVENEWKLQWARPDGSGNVALLMIQPNCKSAQTSWPQICTMLRISQHETTMKTVKRSHFILTPDREEHSATSEALNIEAPKGSAVISQLNQSNIAPKKRKRKGR